MGLPQQTGGPEDLDEDACNALSPHPDFLRSVVDETGLIGEFGVTLEWFSEPVVRPDGTTPPADGPSLTMALREQVGLRLVPKRAADEMIVIDHMERPPAN